MRPCNEQEIGIHVLKVVGKGKAGRGNKNGIAEYARTMGVSRDSLQDYVQAARVAKKYGRHLPDLLPYTTSLSILHRTPEEDWPDLVARMLAGSWTKEQTEWHPSSTRHRLMACRGPQPLADGSGSMAPTAGPARTTGTTRGHGTARQSGGRVGPISAVTRAETTGYPITKFREFCR